MSVELPVGSVRSATTEQDVEVEEGGKEGCRTESNVRRSKRARPFDTSMTCVAPRSSSPSSTPVSSATEPRTAVARQIHDTTPASSTTPSISWSEFAHNFIKRIGCNDSVLKDYALQLFQSTSDEKEMVVINESSTSSPSAASSTESAVREKTVKLAACICVASQLYVNSARAASSSSLSSAMASDARAAATTASPSHSSPKTSPSKRTYPFSSPSSHLPCSSLHTTPRCSPRHYSGLAAFASPQTIPVPLPFPTPESSDAQQEIPAATSSPLTPSSSNAATIAATSQARGVSTSTVSVGQRARRSRIGMSSQDLPPASTNASQNDNEEDNDDDHGDGSITKTTSSPGRRAIDTTSFFSSIAPEPVSLTRLLVESQCDIPSFSNELVNTASRLQQKAQDAIKQQEIAPLPPLHLHSSPFSTVFSPLQPTMEGLRAVSLSLLSSSMAYSMYCKLFSALILPSSSWLLTGSVIVTNVQRVQQQRSSSHLSSPQFATEMKLTDVGNEYHRPCNINNPAPLPTNCTSLPPSSSFSCAVDLRHLLSLEELARACSLPSSLIESPHHQHALGRSQNPGASSSSPSTSTSSTSASTILPSAHSSAAVTVMSVTSEFGPVYGHLLGFGWLLYLLVSAEVRIARFSQLYHPHQRQQQGQEQGQGLNNTVSPLLLGHAPPLSDGLMLLFAVIHMLQRVRLLYLPSCPPETLARLVREAQEALSSQAASRPAASGQAASGQATVPATMTQSIYEGDSQSNLPDCVKFAGSPLFACESPLIWELVSAISPPPPKPLSPFPASSSVLRAPVPASVPVPAENHVTLARRIREAWSGLLLPSLQTMIDAVVLRQASVGVAALAAFHSTPSTATHITTISMSAAEAGYASARSLPASSIENIFAPDALEHNAGSAGRAFDKVVMHASLLRLQEYVWSINPKHHFAFLFESDQLAQCEDPSTLTSSRAFASPAAADKRLSGIDTDDSKRGGGCGDLQLSQLCSMWLDERIFLGTSSLNSAAINAATATPFQAQQHPRHQSLHRGNSVTASPTFTSAMTTAAATASTQAAASKQTALKSEPLPLPAVVLAPSKSPASRTNLFRSMFDSRAQALSSQHSPRRRLGSSHTPPSSITLTAVNTTTTTTTAAGATSAAGAAEVRVSEAKSSAGDTTTAMIAYMQHMKGFADDENATPSTTTSSISELPNTASSTSTTPSVFGASVFTNNYTIPPTNTLPSSSYSSSSTFSAAASSSSSSSSSSSWVIADPCSPFAPSLAPLGPIVGRGGTYLSHQLEPHVWLHAQRTAAKMQQLLPVFVPQVNSTTSSTTVRETVGTGSSPYSTNPALAEDLCDLEAFIHKCAETCTAARTSTPPSVLPGSLSSISMTARDKNGGDDVNHIDFEVLTYREMLEWGHLLDANISAATLEPSSICAESAGIAQVTCRLIAALIREENYGDNNLSKIGVGEETSEKKASSSARGKRELLRLSHLLTIPDLIRAFVALCTALLFPIGKRHKYALPLLLRRLQVDVWQAITTIPIFERTLSMERAPQPFEARLHDIEVVLLETSMWHPRDRLAHILSDSQTKAFAAAKLLGTPWPPQATTTSATTTTAAAAAAATAEGGAKSAAGAEGLLPTDVGGAEHHSHMSEVLEQEASNLESVIIRFLRVCRDTFAMLRDRLGSRSPNMSYAWSLLVRLLADQPHIFVNRHVDTILLCLLFITPRLQHLTEQQQRQQMELRGGAASGLMGSKPLLQEMITFERLLIAYGCVKPTFHLCVAHGIPLSTFSKSAQKSCGSTKQLTTGNPDIDNREGNIVMFYNHIIVPAIRALPPPPEHLALFATGQHTVLPSAADTTTAVAAAAAATTEQVQKNIGDAMENAGGGDNDSDNDNEEEGGEGDDGKGGRSRADVISAHPSRVASNASMATTTPSVLDNSVATKVPHFSSRGATSRGNMANCRTHNTADSNSLFLGACTPPLRANEAVSRRPRLLEHPSPFLLQSKTNTPRATRTMPSVGALARRDTSGSVNAAANPAAISMQPQEGRQEGLRWTHLPPLPSAKRGLDTPQQHQPRQEHASDQSLPSLSRPGLPRVADASHRRTTSQFPPPR